MNGLHLASKEGHINVVLELLARAASVDSSTKVSWTVLGERKPPPRRLTSTESDPGFESGFSD